MKVYIEIQELVWNKYEVLGVSSAQELEDLIEKEGHSNIWALNNDIDVRFEEVIDFIDTNYETMAIYEE